MLFRVMVVGERGLAFVMYQGCNKVNRVHQGVTRWIILDAGVAHVPCIPALLKSVDISTRLVE